MADGAVGAGIALASLLYTTGKDGKQWFHDKKEHAKNLTNNNNKLCGKLQELLGLINDTEAHEEKLILKTSIKAWLTTAREIKEEVEGLVEEYHHKTLRAHEVRKRAKLSKEMEEKYFKLQQHVEAGILLSIPIREAKTQENSASQ